MMEVKISEVQHLEGGIRNNASIKLLDRLKSNANKIPKLRQN